MLDFIATPWQHDTHASFDVTKNFYNFDFYDFIVFKFDELNQVKDYFYEPSDLIILKSINARFKN